MKMIYIANARIPTEKAHGGQIMKMCESFADSGLSVDLVLPQRCNRQFQGVSPFAYYQTKKNFQIKKIYCPDPFFLMNRGGLYIKVQSLFFSLRLFFYLIFKADRDTIIYTRDEYLLPWATLFSRKVVWEAHDLPKFKKTKYWLKCFKIVAITDGLRQEIIDSGVPEKNILTAPDGVDLKMFENINGSREDLRSRLSLPQDEKIVLYAGHLYAWKGVDTLAEAARFFEDEKVKFVFVGGMSKDLEDFNKNYGQEKNILITGHVSQSLVPKYLMSADILVLPNSASSKISSSYTSPLKLFEYMASGRPIIASRLGSLREILTEKECVFFSPDDVRDLAEKIRILLSNDDLAARIAINAGKKVKDCTWGNRAKNIVEFMEYV